MEYLIVILLVCILILLAFFLFKKKSDSHTVQLQDLQHVNQTQLVELARAEERNYAQLKEQERLTEALQSLQGEYAMLQSELHQLKAQRAAHLAQYEAMQTQMLEHKAQMNKEFELIAHKLLEEKSHKFIAENKLSMDHILNPLRENIKAFEQKVDLAYKAEASERNQLQGVIKELMNQSKQIQTDAHNLTKALKGDVKKQGNWGEVILERVLERSGLIKDQEYSLQHSLKGKEGNRLQPDVLIQLPDQKHLIIDAKVSLKAYEQAVNAESEEQRLEFVKQHLASLRSHIQGLSQKAYHHLNHINSPDFVLLFIPIESGFSLAVQQDADLFNYAWDRKIVLVSPSTLLATLRTIASMWKQENQNRNVLEIARLAGNLYDKFVGFTQDMSQIEKHLTQGQDAYEKAMNKLSKGSGNLVVTTEKIKRLGAKTNKQIDDKYITEQPLD